MTNMTAENHKGVPEPVQHSAIHQYQGKREHHHRIGVEEIRQSGGIFERVRGVHAVESAPVGAQHLHRFEGGDRPHDNGLRFGLARVGRAHRPRFKCRNIVRGLKGHRAALGYENEAEYKSGGHEHVDQHTPHIDEEVADR